MSDNFKEYKKNKQIVEAYEEAGKVQESLALSMVRGLGRYGDGRCVDVLYNKEYEGHMAVSDILNKIDAMVRMFERSMKDKNSKESSSKIIEVISNLYDLAQIKMIEAKKQARLYMEKAAGVKIPQEEPEDSLDQNDQRSDDNTISFKMKKPMSFPNEKTRQSDSQLSDEDI